MSGSTTHAGDGPAAITAAQNLAEEAGGSDGFAYLMANEEQRGEFIANQSSLEKDEWEELQDTVIDVRRQRLNLVSDLRDSGLTRSYDLATLTSIWQTTNDVASGAEVTMNPGTRTDADDIEYQIDGVPLPVFHKDWFIDRRMLLASRRMGQGLDTVVPSQMTRAVSELIETTFLNGWSQTVDGRTLYGFTNHPDRNTYTGTDWGDDTSDADNIRNDVLAMIEALENDEFGGPYRLYVSRTQWQEMRQEIADFGSGNPGDTNMRERIQDEFSEIQDVRPTWGLSDGTAVMFQPSREVAQVGLAEDIQPVEWRSNDGWRHHFKILGAMTLELKSTATGQMGVVHATGL